MRVRTANAPKVLLSAYACEPGKGSEPGVGWNLAKTLSKRVELWVLTRPGNRQAIESSGEDWLSAVNWIYWDPPRWLTFWKNGAFGVELFYLIWQIGVYYVAKEIVRQKAIQLCHHVTFGRYWIPSRLASLPVPFIFGPVGGGEESPSGLIVQCSLRGRWENVVKYLASHVIPRLPWNRGLYHKAAWTYAATPQTADKLRQLGVRHMSLLAQSGISKEELPDIESQNVQEPDTLRLVTACRLMHWKAVHLAIEAVAIASRKIDVRLTVLQHGPELENLKRLANRLGVGGIVEFRGRLPSLAQVHWTIADSDALVHPALQEAFGQACLEALALGTPVICLNWGGPGLIVDESCGFAIEPGTKTETVERLAEAMVQRYFQKKDGQPGADACRNRAFGNFHWEQLGNYINMKYEELLAKH